MNLREKARAPVLAENLWMEYLAAVAADWRLTASLTTVLAFVVALEALVVLSILSLDAYLATAQ